MTTSSLLLTAFLVACGGGDSTAPPTGSGTPGIAVSLGVGVVNLTPGGAATLGVTVQRRDGYLGAIALSVAGQPAAVTATVSPATLAAGQTTASIAWAAVSSAPTGSFTVTVTASGNGVAASSSTVQLTIVSPSTLAAALERAGGDGQSVASGSPVPLVPRVLVRDQAGQALGGVAVTFAMDTGAGLLTDSIATSGADGIAAIGAWRPGPGRAVLRASVGTLAPVRFAAVGVGPLTVVDTTIGLGGGTVVVTRPGDPLNGLRVTVPDRAFATPLHMSVSYGDTTGVPRRAGMRIVSPVITISSTGAGFTKDRPFLLNVPARIKSNEWPVVLLFERSTGKLSVLPSRPVDTTSVVAVTRHLDASQIDPDPPASVIAALRRGPVTRVAPRSASLLHERFAFATPAGRIDPSIQLVIGAVSYDSLTKDLETGYESRTDDWEVDPAIIFDDETRFFNSLPLASAWYFDHFKVGGGALNGRFREAAGIGLSNAQGLRMGPPLNAEIDLESIGNLFSALIENFIGGGVSPDSLTLLYTKSGIFVTGRPQILVGIAEAENEPATMLLVHRTRGNTMDVTLGTSAPGLSAPRSIALRGLSFESVTWGAKDPFSDQYKSFTTSAFIPAGQTAGMNAKALNRAWQAVFDGVAGDATLPAYRIATRDNKEALDTIWIPEDTTRFWFECPTCELGLQPAAGITPRDKMAGAIKVERIGGQWVKSTAELVVEAGLKIDSLADGKHFGFVVFNLAEEPDLVSYLDWKEYAVRKRRLTITPVNKTVTVGEEFTLTATLEGRPLPPGATWTWELGDGRTLSGRTEVLTEKYDFLLNGVEKTHKVIARLYSQGELYASGRAEVTVKPAAPYWHITSITDPDSLFDSEENEGSGPIADLFRRLLSAPRSGAITIETAGATTELRVRVLRASLWDPATCCPLPAFASATEMLLPLGMTPPVQFTLGAFFAGWGSNSWSQSTNNLSAGTLTGQYIPGTQSYAIKDMGTQVGPSGGIRINATRNGTAMTGEITVTIWWVDSDSGMIETPPETFRFPFTATRMR